MHREDAILHWLRSHRRLLLLLTALVSLALHLHMLPRDLVGVHVWRQAETQTVIDNFYREDWNILHPHVKDLDVKDRVMRMEFPLMQWVFALFFKIFGSHIIISRLLSFLLGLCTLAGMYRLGSLLFKDKAPGLIAAWAFCFSPVFYYYTVNPLPDNAALCAGVWFAAFLLRADAKSYPLLFTAASAVCLMLATLIKLPFVLYGMLAAALLLQRVFKKELSGSKFLRTTCIYLLLLVPALLWYAWVIPQWHNDGILGGMLLARQNFSGLLYILQSNLISTFPEMIINYGAMLFFACGLALFFIRKKYRGLIGKACLAWALAIVLYFLFELNMIDTVHDYYLFPFLPILMLLVAYGAGFLFSQRRMWVNVFAVAMLLLLPLTAFLRADSRWNTGEPGFNPAYYQYRDSLRSITPPGSLCIVGNDDSHFITPYYIDRNCWVFSKDALSPAMLSEYRQRGARYLFSDSRTDEQEPIRKQLSDPVFTAGTLRVYRLLPL